MSLGEEVGLTLSYIPYGVVYGIIFAEPLAASLSYLVMSLGGIYLRRAGESRWRYYVVLALLGLLVALLTSLASKTFLPPIRA